MLAINRTLALKFHCQHCDQITFNLFHQHDHTSLDCQKCQHPLQILGLVEAQDIGKHPLQIAKALFKAPWQKLSTSH